jgi:hypothetical protein
MRRCFTRTFSLGKASRLEELFRKYGFSLIETHTVGHTFVLPSIEAYYGQFERGGASTSQALAILPDDIRRAVRAEVRRDFRDTSRPIAESPVAGARRQYTDGLRPACSSAIPAGILATSDPGLLSKQPAARQAMIRVNECAPSQLRLRVGRRPASDDPTNARECRQFATSRARNSECSADLFGDHG